MCQSPQVWPRPCAVDSVSELACLSPANQHPSHGDLATHSCHCRDPHPHHCGYPSPRLYPCRDPSTSILTIVGTPAPCPVSWALCFGSWWDGLRPEPEGKCVAAMWVAGGPGSCVLPGCAQVAPRDAGGVPHGLPAWACGLTGQWYVVSGCVSGCGSACVLSSRLASLTLAPLASGLWVPPLPWGCPHWSVVSQGWPCGPPGPHVYLPWEWAAPGRLRSGASMVGEIPALTQPPHLAAHQAVPRLLPPPRVCEPKEWRPQGP